MSPEVEKYYEAYFDMFVTDGWKQFIEDLQEIVDNQRIEDIKDEKHLYLVQGERSNLLRMLNFEEAMKGAYDYMKESESDPQV